MTTAASLVVEHGLALGGRLSFASATHVGARRPHNEDATVSVPELGLFAAADGMGGHKAGEVASRLAVDVLRRTVRERCRSSVPDHRQAVLLAAVEAANLDVWEAGGGKKGGADRMGTTLDAVLFAGQFVVMAHVGDSRIYRFRDGRLLQLTQDHTLIGDYQRMGLMSAKEAEASDIGHVITRALGTQRGVVIDPRVEPVVPRDLYLVCTDGLHGAVTDHEIAQGLALAAPFGVKAALEELFQTAIPWASDNLSAVLIRVEGP